MLNRSWKRAKLRLHRFLADRMSAAGLTDALPAATTLLQQFRRALVSLVARPNRLVTPMMGDIAFQLIRTAYEVGLFRYLKSHPGASAREVGAALGLTEHATDVLLVGMASLELIHRIGDESFNDPYLERALQPEYNDGFFTRWLEFNENLVRPASAWLPDAVRQDRPVGLYQTFGDVGSFYQALALKPEKMKYFDGYMRAVTAINKEEVAAFREFSSFERILDVGGSTGSTAMALARHHAGVEVTVFDFPRVVEIARQNFDTTPDGARLHVIGGDLLQESMPRGFDCITFFHMFGLFGEERSIAMLRRAYDALTPGKMVCVLMPVLDEDEDGPRWMGLFSSYFLFLANGHGRFYSPARVRDWLSRAGFRNIRTVPLPAYEAVFFGER